MRITAGAWKEALIDIDRATEFSGDDVDRYSKVVNLGAEYTKVLVYVPALNASAAVSLCLQRGAAVDTIPSPLHIMDSNATGSFLHANTAATTVFKAIVFHIGASQYLRVYCDANQAADVTFYIKGC